MQSPDFKLGVVSFLGLLLSLSITLKSVAQPEEALQLSINTTIRHQAIDGFGASDAWRVQHVGKGWPLEKRSRIADLLFSQEMDADGNPVGIGLSLWRFNITAGTAEQGRGSGIRNIMRRGECFQNPDGSYDWNKQAGQQWFLRAAKERGVERLLAFPNTPPVHLSANGKGFSDKGRTSINLKPGATQPYADFLADVVEHFSEEGIVFDYLSPVNEPQWDWDTGKQEGTPALNEDISRLVRHLSAELSHRRLPTKIVIAEAGTIGHAAISMATMGEPAAGRDDQARFFFGKESPGYIGDLTNVAPILSAHSYFSVWPIEKQVEHRKQVAQAFHAVDPKLGYWMSEYCILQKNDELGGGSRRDLGMGVALYVARIMHHDLTITHARSWQWWTAVTVADYKDGLIYLDDGSRGTTGRMGAYIRSLQTDGAVRESKLLWVLGNYSRFVRPGMVRVECELSARQSPVNGLLASAYHDPRSGRTVCVLTNLSKESKQVIWQAEGKVVTYTTDEHSDLSYGGQQAGPLSIAARSVVTLVAEPE